MTVAEPLGLPDRRPRLRLVDRVADRAERRVAVGGDGDDRDARLAERRPRRSDGRSRAAPRRTARRSRRRSGRGPAAPSSRGPRSRAIRRTGRRGGRPRPPGPARACPARRRVRPRNPTTAPSSSVASRVLEVGQDRPGDRCLRRSRGSAGRRPRPGRRRATADRRDERDLVAVRERRRRLGVVAVAGEAHRRPARREHRMPRGDGIPGIARRSRRPAARAGPRASRRARAGSRRGGRGRGRALSGPSARSAVASATEAGEEEPVADRQDRRLEPRIGEDRRVERAERARVRLRPGRVDDAAAPEDVVGDDERARRQPRDERLEIALVLRLQGVDEGEVERPGERRLPGRERLERLGVDDRDPLVRRSRPRATSPGRDRSATDRGRSSRSSRRPAGPSPATASSSRTPCRPRRSGAGRRPAPRAPGRSRGRRSGSAPRLPWPRPRSPRARRDERPRQRLDPVDLALAGQPASIVLHPDLRARGRVARHTSRPAPK